ncbi:MAG: Asp-tRNA(Asn)/Glu-tRNA(Gln) amidotransferase subunit GatC [Adlercreutzia equolifaciens]
MTADLNAIIDSLAPITEFDLDGVEPTFHPIGDLSNVMRDDEVRGSFTQEVALENAPKQEDGSFSSRPSWGKGAIANGAHLRRNGHSRDSNRSRRQGSSRPPRWPAAPSSASARPTGGACLPETTEELALDAAACIDAAVAEGRLVERPARGRSRGPARTT